MIRLNFTDAFPLGTIIRSCHDRTFFFSFKYQMENIDLNKIEEVAKPASVFIIMITFQILAYTTVLIYPILLNI